MQMKYDIHYLESDWIIVALTNTVKTIFRGTPDEVIELFTSICPTIHDVKE